MAWISARRPYVKKDLGFSSRVSSTSVRCIRRVSRHRLVRNGADGAAGPAAAQVCLEGRIEFRSRHRRPGAAAKSCELFVADGFEVNVAQLPVGQTPTCSSGPTGAQVTVNG